MANKKVSSTMSTSIALDTLKVNGALGDLQRIINTTNSAWRSASQAMLATGDKLGALKTKINGLSDVMDAERAKIDALKQQQNDLDVTTVKGARSYARYQSQIDRLNASIARQTAQQKRAQESLDYYSSGLGKLKNAYELNNKASEAFVERLRAEGHSYSANRQELRATKHSLSNLKEQYSIQKAELQRLGETLGTTDEKYRKQNIVLNKTATEMAKTKDKISGLRRSLVGLPESKKVNIKTNAETEERHVRSLGEVVKGSVIGIGVASTAMAGLALVTSHVGDAVNRVDTLNNAKRTFSNMGFQAKDTNKAMKDLQDSIMGLLTPLNEATKGVEMVASSTHDVKQAQKVWSALNDAVIGFGGTTDDVNRATRELTESFSNGKIQGKQWNALMNEGLGPALNAIAKEMHMTTGELRDGLSSGKISVKQFQDALIQLDTKGGGGLKSLHKIAMDSTKGIHTAMKNAVTAITRGLGDVIVGWSTMMKKLTGSNLSETITKLGKKGEQALEALSKSLSGVPKVIQGAMPAIKAFKSIFGDLFHGMLDGAKNALEPFSNAIKHVNDACKGGRAFKGFSNLMKDLASHHAIIKTLGASITAVAVGIGALKIAKTVKAGLSGLFSLLTGNPFALVAVSISAVVAGLVELYKQSPKFRNFCKTLLEATKSAFGTIGQIVKGTVGIFAGVAKGWNHFCGNMATDTINLSNKVARGFGNAKKTVSDFFKRAGNSFKNGWATMQRWTAEGVGAITGKNKELHDKMISAISSATGTSKTTLHSAYKTMTDYTQTWKDLMTGKWSKLGGDLKNYTTDLSKTAKSIFSDMYNRLNDMTGGKLGELKGKWSKTWDSIVNGIKGAVRKVGNHAVDMVNDVLKPINNMIKGATDGINWVLDKFGASKIGKHTIPLVSHFATGGTVGKDGQLAMVNDSGTNNYREMFMTKDGQLGAFPKQRDYLTFLPQGTQILDGENSKLLAEALQIPHFKDGTKDKNLFEKIFDKGKDIIEDIGNIIAHPIKFLEKVFIKHIKAIGKGWSVGLIKKAPTYFAKQGLNWVKKLAENFKKSMESSGGAGVVSKNIGAHTGSWRGDIEKIAKEMHVDLHLGDMEALLARIQKESGGDQAIKQKVWDINMANGNPAQGLFQYVPSTFAAWSLPGHNNILSGDDQIRAVFNDSNWRSDIRMPGGWGPTGHHVFANGGFVNGWTNAIIGEAGPEVVIPLSGEKQGRALDLLTRTVNRLNHNAGRNTQVTNTSDNAVLESKLDTMIGLLANILGVNQEQLNKQGNGIDLQGLYRKQYQDQAINNYQAF